MVGKQQQNQNFIYSSLTLGTLNKIKLMSCALFNIGDKIRRLSMNVTFKYIWLQRLNCLTHERIVYLYIMYQSLYDYDYHLSEIRCAMFYLIWLRLWDQESGAINKLKEQDMLS